MFTDTILLKVVKSKECSEAKMGFRLELRFPVSKYISGTRGYLCAVMFILYQMKHLKVGC